MADRLRGPRRLGRPWGVLGVLGVLCVLGVLAAWLVVLTGPGRSSSSDFVTRQGTHLEVGGSRFRFVGFNLYDAAASDIYSCSPATRLDDAGLNDAMRTVADSGGTVVRFWAYQTYTAGGRDFSGVDRVIKAARAHGLRVLPVLEDGPGDCSTGESGLSLDKVDDGTWYTQGYRQPLGNAAISYRHYVSTVARHYRDNPTILAWSLMNEAETGQRDAQGRTVLVDFARDVAAVAHAADPNHLVTLGTQSNGATGASGSDFAAIYALPGLDLTEVHDWGHYGGDSQPLPGALADGDLPDPDQCQAVTAQVACSFALARRLDKPIIVGEAGIAATDGAERTRRAGQFAAKLRAAFGAGASGYLVWQLNRVNTDQYAVILGSHDPLYGVLRAAHRRWSPQP